MNKFIQRPLNIISQTANIEVRYGFSIQSAQYSSLENKLTAAPKKARKLMFTDPFIYHAAGAWLKPHKDPYHQQVTPAIADPTIVAKLAEACVITHYRRHYPPYYIKAAGEVDIAYVDENRFHPVEIKWTNQIRPNDLKQIARYQNGRILTKARQSKVIQDIPTESLPVSLLRLSSKSR